MANIEYIQNAINRFFADGKRELLLEKIPASGEINDVNSLGPFCLHIFSEMCQGQEFEKDILAFRENCKKDVLTVGSFK